MLIRYFFKKTSHLMTPPRLIILFPRLLKLLIQMMKQYITVDFVVLMGMLILGVKFILIMQLERQGVKNQDCALYALYQITHQINVSALRIILDILVKSVALVAMQLLCAKILSLKLNRSKLMCVLAQIFKVCLNFYF